MPRYVIERQYLLPVYEHLLIEAPNFETACREALDEIAHPWSENAKMISRTRAHDDNGSGRTARTGVS